MAGRSFGGAQAVQRIDGTFGVAGGTGDHARQQCVEITAAPEMAFQAPAPLRRNVERIHQRGEQAEIADLHFELGETGGPQSLHRQRHHLDIAGRAVAEADQLGAGLKKLRRPVARAIAEGRAVIAKPRRIGPAALRLPGAGGNGEVGAQAKLAARRIGQLERPSTDFLAERSTKICAGCRMAGSWRV